MVRPLNGHQFWLFVFAVLGAVAIAQPASAQSGMIQGVVTDAQGKPVENAKVTIAGPGRTYETKTSKKGEYAQLGLATGTYNIAVEKDRLRSEGGAAIRQGLHATVNFTLAAGAVGTGLSKEAAEQQRLFNEGTAAAKAGNYDAAIATFTKAAEIAPGCAGCYNNIGLSLAGKKDFEKAEAAYKTALELDAANAESYTGLANIYNTQKKFDMAAAASAKAAELAGSGAGASGGGAEGLFNQGVILWNAGKVADAKKQFEAAIAADAKHAESHYQLGMALVNEGNLKGAGAEFDTYLKLAPAGPNAATAKSLAAQLPK